MGLGAVGRACGAIELGLGGGEGTVGCGGGSTGGAIGDWFRRGIDPVSHCIQEERKGKMVVCCGGVLGEDIKLFALVAREREREN